MLPRTAHKARFSVSGEHFTAVVALKTCCHCTLLHTVTTIHYCILSRHSSTYFYCFIVNTGTSHCCIPPHLHLLPHTTTYCHDIYKHLPHIHRCGRGLCRGLEATLGNIPVPEAAWEQTLAPVRLGGIGLRSPSTIQRAARLASLGNTRSHWELPLSTCARTSKRPWATGHPVALG